MIWSLSGNAMSFVLQFVGSVAVARVLTPGEMGVYAVAFSTMVLISALQNLGFQGFIVRESELDAAKIGSVLMMAMLQAIGLALLLYVGAPVLAHVVRDERVTIALRILCVFALLTPVDTVLQGLLQRRLRFDLVVLSNLLRVVTSMSTAVLLAYNGMSYMSLSIGAAFGAAMAATVTTISVWLSGAWLPARPTLAAWREIWAYGSRILMTLSLANILNRLPDIVLGRLCGMPALGLYGRASGIVDVIAFGGTTGFGQVMLKALSEQQGNSSLLGSSYMRGLRACIGLFWPALVGLAVLSGPVVLLVYGEQWLPAAPILSLLSIAAVIQLSTASRDELLIAAGRVTELPRMEAVGGIAGLTLFTLGATVGLTAAAAGRIAGHLVAHFVYSHRIRAATGLGLRAFYASYIPSISATLAAAAPAALLMAAHDWSPFVPVGDMAAAIAGGIVMWLAALFLVKHDLAGEARRLLNRRQVTAG